MESRLAQSKTCSCSYSTARKLAAPAAGPSRPSWTSPSSHSHTHHVSRRHQHQQDAQPTRPSSLCAASARPEPSSSAAPQQQQQQSISGYTPANFISFSDKPEHRCHHLIGVEVDAPASVCFSVWNDWNRLVEFLDLVAQIGLDPSQENFALFQCFYRWGLLPVLEIVFLMEKTHVEQNKLIRFETVQGMPASGDVQFIEKDGRTTVLFKLQHQLPNLLVDLQVETFAVESSCRDIFTDNLLRFKQLAEGVARNSATLPRTAAQPGYGSVGIHLNMDDNEEEEEAAGLLQEEEEGEDEEEEVEEEVEEAGEVKQLSRAAEAAAAAKVISRAAPEAAGPAGTAAAATAAGGEAVAKKPVRRKAAAAAAATPDAVATMPPVAAPKTRAKSTRSKSATSSSG